MGGLSALPTPSDFILLVNNASRKPYSNFNSILIFLLPNMQQCHSDVVNVAEKWKTEFVKATSRVIMTNLVFLSLKLWGFIRFCNIYSLHHASFCSFEKGIFQCVTEIFGNILDNKLIKLNSYLCWVYVKIIAFELKE